MWWKDFHANCFVSPFCPRTKAFPPRVLGQLLSVLFRHCCTAVPQVQRRQKIKENLMWMLGQLVTWTTGRQAWRRPSPRSWQRRAPQNLCLTRRSTRQRRRGTEASPSTSATSGTKVPRENIVTQVKVEMHASLFENLPWKNFSLLKPVSYSLPDRYVVINSADLW